MKQIRGLTVSGITIVLCTLFVGMSGCGSARSNDEARRCVVPTGHDPDTAFRDVQHALNNGCEHRFDDYFAYLLTVAEGDPGPENKRMFSEFLIAMSDDGLISKRQAQTRYNRYFNVKFVSLQGDFNNCTQTCPIQRKVMTDMEDELVDKEQGLLKVSADTESYYRADQLLKETELVLEATCLACGAQP